MAYFNPRGIQGHDKQGVCRKHKRINMPPNRYLIDSKWVFKNKRDGRFRARLVPWGYTQITGVLITSGH